MNLHTITHGSASEPLVGFCHGLFGQGKNWTSTARMLEKHDPPFRSLLMDMPNHGRSEWSDSIDLVQWADWVADTLRINLQGQDQVDLVGHSLGGKIAMILALRHPGLVRSLVVVDMSPVDYDMRHSHRSYIEGMQHIDLATLPGRVEADEQLRQIIADETIRAFLLQNLRRTDDADEPWRWMMNLALFDEQFDRLGAWPPVEGRYDGPVLWVGGADSDYITDAHRPAMRRLFPNVRNATVKNAGHWVHSEQPEVFQKLLATFLEHHR